MDGPAAANGVGMGHGQVTGSGQYNVCAIHLQE